MGKLFKKYKWMQIFLGCLLLVAGIVTIIIDFINVGTLTTVLSIIIAVVLFTFGIFIFLVCLMENSIGYFTSSMGYASLMIALGVVLCIQHQFIGQVILYFVAVSALAFGICELIKSVVLIKYHGRNSYIILGFVLAALGITLGVTCLCLQNKAIILQIVYFIVGSIFIAAGTVEVIYGIKLARLK